MLEFFANIFGYVLNFLYNLVGNFGVAIILFSILVKVLMIPISWKQQKSMKKNQEMQAEMKQIQEKFKNDQEALNREMMALYKREGASPFSGCLSSILQIILLLSVFMLVRAPLTHMVKMDKDVISKLTSVVQGEDKKNNGYIEIEIIQYFRNDENVQKVKENTELNIGDGVDQVKLNMDFLGIDLSQVPTKNLKDVKTLIIPILYVITSFISIKLTSNMTGKKKEEKKLITDGVTGEVVEDVKQEDLNPMADASKTMTWIMPIMSVSIAIIAPLGLALYWLMNNILMIIERLVYDKILNKEEAKENA